MKKNEQNNDKIVKFPSKADRQKATSAEEKRLKKQHKAEKTAAKHAKSPPMFNFDRIPPFTRALIGAIILVHIVLYLLISADTRLFIIYNLGFTPATFSSLFTETNAAVQWSWLALLTPITHIFIHGNWLHLIFNSAMGLALCIFFERSYGSAAAIKFFAACSIGGAAMYFILSPFSPTPIIGASGGISGLFGAVLYTMLQQIQHQPTNHYSTASIMNGQQQLRKKAAEIMRNKGPWPIIIFWGFLMTLLGMLSGSNVAWSAHLGGYATGVALITLLSKGKIRL